MDHGQLAVRTEELHASRTPYVRATVVRVEAPTSAKPGDTAVVLPDGAIEGFVGGSCAESTVRAEAARLLESGGSIVLRITPDAAGEQPSAGCVTVANPCMSGGTMDLFLEAVLPPPLVYVFGDAPIARAVARVGQSVGYEVTATTDPPLTIAPDTAAVVVATHDRDEDQVLVAALAAGVPYVGLVASQRRGTAVVAALDVPEEDRSRVHTPAGLAIGARTPAEVALAVLAEVVAARRSGNLSESVPAMTEADSDKLGGGCPAHGS